MAKNWLKLPEAVQHHGGPAEPARRAILEGGQGEEFTARLRSPETNKIERMQGHHWRPDEIDWEKSTRTTLAMAHGDRRSYRTDLIEIDRETFEAYLAPAQQQRHAGGRPPKWDWEAFWIEVVVRIYGHGLPSTDAELIQQMLQWFSDRKDGEQPARSEIARRVATLRQRLNSI